VPAAYGALIVASAIWRVAILRLPWLAGATVAARMLRMAGALLVLGLLAGLGLWLALGAFSS
jgi:hypothetical protein